MRLPCTISVRPDGRWTIRHSSRDLGTVEVTAATRDEAIQKMRGELRYRLELCPCTGEQYRDLEIELAPEPALNRRGG
jgi:hypothetical protein